VIIKQEVLIVPHKKPDPRTSNLASIATASARSRKRRWARRFLVALFALVALLLVSDIRDRMEFSYIYQQVEQIRHSAIGPAGGVEVHAAGFPVVRGDGLPDILSHCLGDMKCPEVSREWLVSVELGREQEFARAILQHAGYEITSGDRSPCSLDISNVCGVSGLKGSHEMSIDVRRVSSDTPQPPVRDVSPKVWRVVGVGMGLK
jgi:hypothetical protein